MRKNLSFKVLFVITTVVVLNSCGLHYTYTYHPDASKTGKILLKPTKSTNETTFRLNDSIIFSEKRVKSVTIENLPDGNYSVQYTGLNYLYSQKTDTTYQIEIKNGNPVSDTITITPAKKIYRIAGSIAIAGAVLLYLSLFI